MIFKKYLTLYVDQAHVIERKLCERLHFFYYIIFKKKFTVGISCTNFLNVYIPSYIDI